jgi:hypothetical protein
MRQRRYRVRAFWKTAWPAFVASLFVVSVQIIALAQAGAPPIGLPPELTSHDTSNMVTWAFQVGGPLFVALLIVLFFYRKDFRTELAAKRSDNAMLMELVKANITSMQATASSVQEHTRAVDRLVAAISERRRSGD